MKKRTCKRVVKMWPESLHSDWWIRAPPLQPNLMIGGSVICFGFLTYLLSMNILLLLFSGHWSRFLRGAHSTETRELANICQIYFLRFCLCYYTKKTCHIFCGVALKSPYSSLEEKNILISRDLWVTQALENQENILMYKGSARCTRI